MQGVNSCRLGAFPRRLTAYPGAVKLMQHACLHVMKLCPLVRMRRQVTAADSGLVICARSSKGCCKLIAQTMGLTSWPSLALAQTMSRLSSRLTSMAHGKCSGSVCLQHQEAVLKVYAKRVSSAILLPSTGLVANTYIMSSLQCFLGTAICVYTI